MHYAGKSLKILMKHLVGGGGSGAFSSLLKGIVKFSK